MHALKIGGTENDFNIYNSQILRSSLEPIKRSSKSFWDSLILIKPTRMLI